MKSSRLRHAVHTGHLRELDRYLAESLCEIHQCDDELILVTTALLNGAAGEGHVCLELNQWAGKAVFVTTEFDNSYTLPELESWCEQLQNSALVSTSRDTPLVLDATHRLYLSRYYDFEQRIGTSIRNRLVNDALADSKKIMPILNKYFPAAGKLDRQKLAAAIAMLRPLTIISGGPGTGKTRTVSRLLAMYQELSDTPSRRSTIHSRRCRR
ncbi:MAG: AAA family ATPase, partial [Gammaproteobacteria bacterium]|nr:AAA family ATPase [Gammaproteobacteria bacterium]